MIQDASKEKPVLILAFNKRIADEMRDEVPSTTTVRTFNSLGHRIWAKAVGSVTLDPKKTQTLFSEEVKDLKGKDKVEARDSFWDIIGAVALAKSLGYVPPDKFSNARRLISQETFHASLDTKPSPLVIDLIDSILLSSIKTAYKGNIDYNDQIYMPALFGGSFPRFPIVLVDEAQDLSPTNHAMLDKLVRGRICAVGDRWQSIYGFRGAVTNGVERIKQTFNMQEQELSISFRCPRVIVEAARWRVPSFKWIKDGGHYEVLHSLRPEGIPDNAAIICRNNAPLFRVAFNLLSSKRSVTVAGSDIGPRITRILRKLGTDDTSQADLVERICQWKDEKLRVTNAEATVRDMAECMKVFASFGKTLGQAVSYAEALFKQQGTIRLLTGHKAKGGEWDTVYHLDPWLIGDSEQELNLRYVASTRAMESLFEIDSERIKWH